MIADVSLSPTDLRRVSYALGQKIYAYSLCMPWISQDDYLSLEVFNPIFSENKLIANKNSLHFCPI